MWCMCPWSAATPRMALGRLARGLLAGILVAAWAPAARAAYGELRRVASEVDVPAGWVILSQERNPLAADESEQTPWLIMDTAGAPPGLRLDVLCVSPVPDGWTLVGRHEDRARGDHYLVIQAPVPVDLAPAAPEGSGAGGADPA